MYIVNLHTPIRHIGFGEVSTARSPCFAYAVLGLLVLLAAGLRFYHLGEWSYFVDELHTAVDTPIRATQAISNLLAIDYHHAFWLLTQFAFNLFGTSAFSLRIFPCIIGIATIPILYFIIKAISNYQIALLSTSLLTISNWHVFMSQMARWYTLLLLTSFLSLISFYCFIETKNIKYILIFLVTFYFSLTLHLSAFFIAIIAYVYILLLLLFPAFRPAHISTRQLFFFVLLPLICIPYLVQKFYWFLSYWQETPWEHGVYGEDILIKLIYQITPSILLVTLSGALLLIHRKDRRGLFFSIYSFLPLLALSIASTFKINVATRYALISLPACLILASFFYFYIYKNLETHKRMIISILILLLCSLTLQSNYFYYTSYYGNRGRLKEAIPYLKANHLPTDSYMPYGLHAVKNHLTLSQTAKLEGFDIPDANIIDPSLNAMPAHGRIWILTLNHMRPNSTGLRRWMSDQAHLMAEYPANLGPQDYTLKIYLYTPPD